MVKKRLIPEPSYVLIFVEGDTDEVFFKALISYYSTVSTSPLRPYLICNLKGVTRYSSKLLAKLRNEYIPTARSKGYAITAVCCSYDTDVFEAKGLKCYHTFSGKEMTASQLKAEKVRGYVVEKDGKKFQMMAMSDDRIGDFGGAIDFRFMASRK